jgi:two-component system sensor histidine kinase DesK
LNGLNAQTDGTSRLKRVSWLRAWSLFAAGWIVFIAIPVYGFLQTQPDVPGLLAVLGGTAVFVGLYLWLLLRNPYTTARDPAALRTRLLLLAALTLLALALAQGGVGPWILIFAVIAAGAALPPRDAVISIVLLTVLTSIFGWATDGQGLVVLSHAGLGIGVIVVRQLVISIGELQAARKELARLAVTEERLRFARDLHDLVGRNLSLITLKSELAGRLATASPERAAEEMREVERTARESLAEVREAVAGYRRPTLEAELEGAREMLQAAGISCTIENEAGVLGVLNPVADATLAWAVREGVTNVIRHSRAANCEIRLSMDDETANAEVIDDGPSAVGEEPEKGSGLAGVAERVSENGGRLEAGPLFEGGFRLYVRLPLSTGESPSEVADGASGSPA